MRGAGCGGRVVAGVPRAGECGVAAGGDAAAAEECGAAGCGGRRGGGVRHGGGGVRRGGRGGVRRRGVRRGGGGGCRRGGRLTGHGVELLRTRGAGRGLRLPVHGVPARRVRIGVRTRQRHRGVAEPPAGALGWRVLGLQAAGAELLHPALGLADEAAERGALATVAAGNGLRHRGLLGEAEGLQRLGAQRDDAGGEHRLRPVAGVEGGDGVLHERAEFGAEGGFGGGVAGQRGDGGGEEVGEDDEGDGGAGGEDAGRVGDGGHGRGRLVLVVCHIY